PPRADQHLPRPGAYKDGVALVAEGQTRPFPAGGVDLPVFMRRLPARGFTPELASAHTDPAPESGRRHAYGSARLRKRARRRERARSICKPDVYLSGMAGQFLSCCASQFVTESALGSLSSRFLDTASVASPLL